MIAMTIANFPGSAGARYRRGCCFQGEHCAVARNHRTRAADQFGSKRWKSVKNSLRPAVFERQVLVLERRLLRACREWPSRYRAAESV
jgi:hypothetical protein